MPKVPVFTSLMDFYPYYLTEHLNDINRMLHFIGTTIVIMIGITTILTQNWWLMFYAPLAGYGFAWVGHFFFEKNRPATFSYPLWSLQSDFIMYYDTIMGTLNDKIVAARRRFNIPDKKNWKTVLEID